MMRRVHTRIMPNRFPPYQRMLEVFDDVFMLNKSEWGGKKAAVQWYYRNLRRNSENGGEQRDPQNLAVDPLAWYTRVPSLNTPTFSREVRQNSSDGSRKSELM